MHALGRRRVSRSPPTCPDCGGPARAASYRTAKEPGATGASYKKIGRPYCPRCKTLIPGDGERQLLKTDEQIFAVATVIERGIDRANILAGPLDADLDALCLEWHESGAAAKHAADFSAWLVSTKGWRALPGHVYEWNNHYSHPHNEGPPGTLIHPSIPDGILLKKKADQ